MPVTGVDDWVKSEDEKLPKSPISLTANEGEEPPSSQVERGADFARSKSTPSTLSEELEDHILSEGEASQRRGRAKGLGRKRGAVKSTGSGSRETSEDRPDGKRKPRKSARLG